MKILRIIEEALENPYVEISLGWLCIFISPIALIKQNPILALVFLSLSWAILIQGLEYRKELKKKGEI